jgi:acyl dehydratase
LGVDEVRWSAPVYPDDSLRNILEVFEVHPSKSKPDRGILKLKHKILNQNDEVVMTFITIKMLRREAGQLV